MLRVLAAAFVVAAFLSGCAVPSAKNVDPQDAARMNAVVNAIEASIGELCEDPAYADDFVACEFDATIMNGSSPRGLATAQGIYISEGMLSAARNDSELAFVIGHEAAHVVLGHLQSLRSHSLKEIELEADEYGLLFAKRAGYDPYASFTILRRVENAVTRDSSAGFATHPSFSERRTALENTVRKLERRDTNFAENTPR